MKFKYRIIAAVTISSVLFNLIFSFFVIRKEMNTEEERLNSKIAHYNTLIENINTGSLWDFDADKIRANLNIIFSDPEVYEIHLRDITWTIDILLKKEGDLKDTYKKIYELKIIKDGLTLGEASIVYSSELYSSKLYRLITEKLLLTLGIIFINIIAVYFISGYLLHPIDSIVEALKEIDSGNRNVRLAINTGDEFGEIEKYFNKMAGTIQSEIEARTEREKQLNDMHQYLSSLFDSIPSILLSLDITGAIRSINSAAEVFTGIKSSDILGKNVLEVFPLLAEFSDDIHSVLKSQKKLDIKNHYKSDDGELQMEISISSLYHGGITGAVVRIDDVTVIRKKDEKLTQAQMMDSIGNLAGGIAHDFNNVLSGITGTVSLLKHRLTNSELRHDDLLKFLNVIDDSGKRAVDLTRQILALSRKSEMTMETTDLNEILKHVYNFCFHSFDKSIDIQASYHHEPALATVDLTRIEQVLLNLCINAGDAMTVMRPQSERGGGTLNISIRKFPGAADTIPDTFEAEKGRSYWKITVEDNGIGMDKRTVERIFEPFFTTKAKGKGTGLGLAMAYNTVHLHNGFIDVTSEPGKGSVFSIYLPANTDGDLKKSELHGEIIPGEGKIFIVDDEESICTTSKELLEYCGYEVVTECNPELAVQRFDELNGDFNCMLLDLNMPKIDGFEILKTIKQKYPDIKILISSGSITEEKMSTLAEAGASGFITKPFTIESLSKAVSKALS